MTTNSFRHDERIAAPAAAVYAALTTERGLRGWWTAAADVAGAGVGGEVTVRFGRTFKRMRVERLAPDAEVGWRCVEGHIHAPGVLARADEWTGTTITFRLAPRPGGHTLLRLEHGGLTPQVECYDLCSQGWAQFMNSLRAYAETGAGSPFAEPVA